MWTSISNWLHRVSTTWVAVGTLMMFLSFSALVLPAQSARAETYANGAESPDTSLFYSASDLYEAAEAYGEQGRAAYVRARFTFDLIWPLVYALFLTTAISWVSARALAPESRGRLANLVPVLGALFDYLENGSTSIVMVRYPTHTPVVDTLAPVFTLVKWILVGGSFVLLFGIALLGLGRWVKGRATR
jgi:hypothetical protein